MTFKGKTMFTVCFDIDGTLRDYSDKPRTEIITLLQAFKAIKNIKVYVWSGGGVEYAQRIVSSMGLEIDGVIVKGSVTPDLAIDDQTVDLGIANLRSNPLNLDGE